MAGQQVGGSPGKKDQDDDDADDHSVHNDSDDNDDDLHGNDDEPVQAEDWEGWEVLEE